MGMEFEPAVKETLQLKLEPEIVAAAPLHVTPATPDKASPSVPETPMDGVLRAIADPLGGDPIVMLGGVLSNLTVIDALVLLPALSTTVPVTTWFFTSVVT